MSYSKPSATGAVIIYTDGGCLGNPGPGGYGVVLRCGKQRKELSGGFARTTNNRMEIMAAIAGLEWADPASQVTLYSDSKYLVDALEKGWVKKWQAKGWWRTKKELAKNVDLWEKLLTLCKTRTVTFKWVKGHAGDPNNERCDELAKQAMHQKNLPPDEGYLNPWQPEDPEQAGLFG